jgi:hypothetical protein
MLLTFRGALSAGENAGLELSAHKRPIRLRLARQHTTGGRADLSTVLVQPDAAEKLIPRFFRETRIGACSARLDALERGVDAVMHETQVNARLHGVGGEHLMGCWHGEASRALVLSTTALASRVPGIQARCALPRH